MAQPNDGANNPMRSVGTPSGSFPAIPQIDYGVELSKPPSPQPVIDYAGVILSQMQQSVNQAIQSCIRNAGQTLYQLQQCVNTAIDTVIGGNSAVLHSLGNAADETISHFRAASWEYASSIGVMPSSAANVSPKTISSLKQSDPMGPQGNQSFSPIIPPQIQQQLQPPQPPIIIPTPPPIFQPPQQPQQPQPPQPISTQPPQPPIIIPTPPPVFQPPQPPQPPIPITSPFGVQGNCPLPQPPAGAVLGILYGQCCDGQIVYSGIALDGTLFGPAPGTPLTEGMLNGSQIVAPCPGQPPIPTVPPPPIPTVPPPPTGICPPPPPCPVVPVVRVEACRTYDLITDIARGQLTDEQSRLDTYFGQVATALTDSHTASEAITSLFAITPRITADEVQGDYFNQGPLITIPELA